METYMQVLQKNINNQQLFMDLQVSITMDVKNQQLLGNLYAGIAMVVKNQQLLQDLYVGIVHLKWPYEIIIERM